MERGDAVDAVRPGKSEVRHPHASLAALVDQADRRDRAVVDAVRAACFAQQLGVDRVDDLHVPRQQALEQRQRPALQRLGQQCVVGVAEGGACDLPRFVEREFVVVDQQPHELGDRHRGMRVVELDRGLVGQRADVAEILDVAADDVLDRRGREEILLAQAEFLAGGGGVVGVEDARERLGTQLVGERAGEIAGVEAVELDRIERAGSPQPERVDVLAAPADHGRVDGCGLDCLGRAPMDLAVVRDGDLATEADEISALAAFELPRIAVREPVLGHLDLPAIVDPLAEHAVHVADAVAVGGQREARHALHEARGKPAEAAIAERRVGLDLFEFGEVDAVELQGLRDLVVALQIGHRVAQQPADQEFEAKIIDALGAGRVRRLGRRHPAFDDIVADGQDRRRKPVVRPRGLGILADAVDERV